MATNDDRLVLKHERTLPQEGDPTILLVEEGTDISDASLNRIGSLLKDYKKKSVSDQSFLESVFTQQPVAHAPPVNEFGGEFADAEALDKDGGQLHVIDGQATDKSTKYYTGDRQTLGKYIATESSCLANYPSSVEKSASGIGTVGQVTVLSVVEAAPGSLRAEAINALSSELLKHNRFTSIDNGNGAFLPGSIDERDFDAQKGAIMQTLMGVHKKDGPRASFELLSKIGSRLMHRAIGIDVEDPDTLTGEFVGEIITAMFTSQGGATKIDPHRVEVSSLTGLPTSVKLQGEVVARDDFDLNLYGINPVMNTDVLPFAGFAPLGMIGLAIALSVALSLVLKLSFFLISLAPAGSLVPTDIPGKAIARRDEIGFGLLSLADIGIRDTTFPFSKAVSRGVDVFFGIVDNDTDRPLGPGQVNFTGLPVRQTLARVTRSPGFYAVLCRQILKGGNSLAGAFSDIGKSSSATAVQNVLDLADELKSSPIIAALNMFAGIGDIALSIDDLGAQTDEDIVSIADNTLSFDKAGIAVSRVAKGRVDGQRTDWRVNDRRQTISAGLIPSMLLLPSAISKAADIFGSDRSEKIDALVKRFDKPETVELRTMIANRDNKFDETHVKAIEAQLDSEYMPFYFHDLRTNEIVAFHAFLKQLNDSFSVKVEETNAYGRVDPVLTYSSTRRAISMQFVIAAMGPSDYEEMWLKINKLTTLIYPQWSEGRQVLRRDNNESFIQPFSQIPNASPLIRLRLGDLFKSNYSKFALARLFGAGTTQFTVGGNDETIDIDNANAAVLSQINQQASAIIDNKIQVGSRVWYTGYTSKYFLERNELIPDRPNAHKVFPPGEVEVISHNLLTGLYSIKNAQGNNGLATIEQLSLIDARTITPDAATKLKKSNERAETTRQARANFFDKAKNPIVRAFEASAGKGLAGMITSLSFDWFEAVWQIDETSGKAPQWCTVTIEFQPIHDIAPGIDSKGFNRAPIYNVGSIMRDIS